MYARVLVAALALALTACGVPDDGAGTEAPADTTTTTLRAEATTTVGTTITSEAEMGDESEIVEKAIHDLADHLSISESEIEVMEVRDVRWPDGALGCPEPGKLYTQAIVDGWRVILGADERVYDYHAGTDGEPFLCPSDEIDGGHIFVPPPRFDE